MALKERSEVRGGIMSTGNFDSYPILQHPSRRTAEMAKRCVRLSPDHIGDRSGDRSWQPAEKQVRELRSRAYSASRYR
jgi:hypothetical protein